MVDALRTKCVVFIILQQDEDVFALRLNNECVCLCVLMQVGKAMSSNESAAYDIMRSLDVDYVLIIFGGVIGYSGDDINKFLWMVRIAEGEHPKDIRVS